MTFSEKTLSEFHRNLKKYETKEIAILPTLHLAMKEFGYISPEAIRYVATLLDVPPSRVEEVTRFYTMLKTKPVGKYHIQVCINVTCSMFKSRELVKQIEEHLGLTGGKEMTDDKKYSIERVECLASCGTAPAVIINDTLYEKVTFESFKTILGKL